MHWLRIPTILQGAHHHDVTLLLAAVMDRWPSFSRFGSRKVLKFHRCLRGWRHLAPARTLRSMQTLVWEGIVAQLTLLKQPLMAAFVLISLLTNMRPSELLSQKKRSRPTAGATSSLLLCRDRSFRDGGVDKDRSPRWIDPRGPARDSMGEQALARLDAGNPHNRIWTFDYTSGGNVQGSNQLIGTQRHDHGPDTAPWCQHRPGSWVQNSARSSKAQWWRAFRSVARCYAVVCSRLTPCVSVSKQTGNPRAMCRSTTGGAVVNPPPYRHVSGICWTSFVELLTRQERISWVYGYTTGRSA